MRTKKQKTPIPPENFWTLRRDPKATREHPRRIEVQTWGIDANHQLVHAGVYWVNAVNGRWAWKLHHNWTRWRRWYDNLPWNRGEDYPAKRNKPVAFFGIHPVEDPTATVWIKTA